MQIGDNIVLSEIVDGQIFYLPNFQQWEELLNTDPIINGKLCLAKNHKVE